MSKKNISSIIDILNDIRQGKMVILTDDENRENEGDLIMAAEHITTEAVNFMATHGRGLICLPLSEEHCQKLGLSMMTTNNKSPHRTAFTISIEAAQGITTGISAADRAHTIKTAVRKDASAKDIVEPGHIFPLKAQKGGVLTRTGHTEAACDLARLAGLSPAGVICEILNADGTMARYDDLVKFSKTHNIKIGTIADLVEYRMTSETLIERLSSTPVEIFGMEFLLNVFIDKTTQNYHIALTNGLNIPENLNSLITDEKDEVMVRVHFPFSEFDFIQGNVSYRNGSYALIECLRSIKQFGKGALIGLRSFSDENDKIGRLINRLKSNTGEDDSENKKNWDPKIYGTGAQIIRNLGIRKMQLISHPINLANLKGFGLEITKFISKL